MPDNIICFDKDRLLGVLELVGTAYDDPGRLIAALSVIAKPRPTYVPPEHWPGAAWGVLIDKYLEGEMRGISINDRHYALVELDAELFGES